MTVIRKLRDASPAPDERVIAVLEKFVALAKAGELRGVIVIADLVESSDSEAAGTWNGPKALWALETWKHRFLHDIQVELTYK